MAEETNFRLPHDTAAAATPASTSIGGHMSLGKILSEHAALFSGDNALHSAQQMAAYAVLETHQTVAGGGSSLGQRAGYGAGAPNQQSLVGYAHLNSAAPASLDNGVPPCRALSGTIGDLAAGAATGGAETDAFAHGSVSVASGGQDDSRVGAVNLRHVLGKVQQQIDSSTAGGGGTFNSGNDSGGNPTLAAVLGGLASSDVLLKQQQQALGHFGGNGSSQHVFGSGSGGAHLGVNALGGMVRNQKGNTARARLNPPVISLSILDVGRQKRTALD